MDSPDKKVALVELRHRGASLTAELASAEATLEKVKSEPIEEPRTMIKIRARKEERARLENEVRRIKEEQREVLRHTKDLAKPARAEEAA